WEEEIGPSPAPTRGAGVRLRSIPLFPAPSSTTLIPKPGLPTSWPACRITLPSAFTNCCLGIGSLRASLTPLKRDQPAAKNDLAGGRRRMRTLGLGRSGIVVPWADTGLPFGHAFAITTLPRWIARHGLA